MKLTKTIGASIVAATIAGSAFAETGPTPQGIPHLDHVFVIMMENHSYQQVVGNPAMPFINKMISSGSVNVANEYFAIGHPSLTNYLEIVGGSNFGVRSDNAPDWHNDSCRPNLQTGIVNADDDSGTSGHPPTQFDTGLICPIGGFGIDAQTEAVDDWNETSPPVFNYLANIDGVHAVPAARTTGITIADQLVNAGLSWKSYQESLPVAGADQVDSSNGTATNLTTFDASLPLSPTNLPGVPTTPVSGVVSAYAVKHNPFAYFASVQNGSNPGLSLAQVVSFDGRGGLYADLASGHVPSYSFIAPNQCDDQHGRGNSDSFCQYDPGVAAYQGLTNGAQLGLNPGLSAQADVTIKRVVTAITSSPVWHSGNNAIVIVWDENDYSGIPAAPSPQSGFSQGNLNQVVLTVQLSGNTRPVHSDKFYDSFSLLKTIEAGFGLPCLNHACDKDVAVMSDLFGARR